MKWTCEVGGTPRPQGSKTASVIGGRAIMRESNKHVRGWRQEMHDAFALVAPERPFMQCAMWVNFYMPRPKSHYRSNGELKATAPMWCHTKPDMSKLVRAVEDSLVTAGVMVDDSMIVKFSAYKKYAGNGHPAGIVVILSDVDDGNSPAGDQTLTREEEV